MPAAEAAAECADVVPAHCPGWAAAGECRNNAEWMARSCAASCGHCSTLEQPDGSLRRLVVESSGAAVELHTWEPTVSVAELNQCIDHDASCRMWATQGECDANPEWMHRTCLESCFSCQSYRCHDKREAAGQCIAWSDAGRCEQDVFMLELCPYTCGACWQQYDKPRREGMLDSSRADCMRGADEVPAAGVNETFTTMLMNSQLKSEVLHRDPWVVHFDSFLSDTEADELVTAAGHHFQQSVDINDEPLPQFRTSKTSWCDIPSCLEDPRFQVVRARISKLINVPWSHSEHLQLLRYEEGQYYREHHDQTAKRFSAWGPRMYTFFMYLSEAEGGETRFPRLNITVTPRKGSAVIWPSVHAENPYMMDERTRHEALPVTKGIKYAANFWVHMWDFQRYFAASCANANYLQPDSQFKQSWERSRLR